MADVLQAGKCVQGRRVRIKFCPNSSEECEGLYRKVRISSSVNTFKKKLLLIIRHHFAKTGPPLSLDDQRQFLKIALD